MKQININPAIELIKIQMAQMGDLISQAQAARILAYSPQYITKLIKNGIISTYTVAGRKCLSRAEVLRLLRIRQGEPNYQTKAAEFHARRIQKREERKRERQEAEGLPDLDDVDKSQEPVPVSRYFRKRSSRTFDDSLAD
jgi:hypothetical protein